MEFLTQSNISPPKNLYPCLATITIHPSTDTKTRRLSTSSSNQGEDDNVLKRIASGGRRKSEAGSERRKSFLGGQSGSAVDPSTAGSGLSGPRDRGTWYWRVQAGVTDNALVLLPLTQPANPLLTSPPAPLSEVMPAHAAHSTGHHADGAHDEGLVDKMKNLFRRGSAVPKDGEKAVPHPDTATTAQGDRVLDQTAQGEQLPSAKANAAGATNVNANAETGWPGVIDGEKLKAVAVPVNSIEKGKVSLGGGKKGDGYYVHVPITSYFSAMTAGFSDTGAKSGSIRLEFDKDWIGAKAESELLHYHLSTAISDPRAPPSPTTFQIGGGAGAGAHTFPDQSGRRSSQVDPSAGGQTTSAAVAGVENESVSSGRKVPGEA